MDAKKRVSRPFTEFLRTLGPESEIEDIGAFELAWEQLRRTLRRELRLRGLSQASPSFLGIEGANSWTPDAIEELLTDCYVYTFVKRLESLLAHLDLKENIDGLVVLSVRNFVHERQRRNDRFGYRVFDVLHQAVEEGVADGTLRVSERYPPLRNKSVLIGPDSQSKEVESTPEGFDQTVRNWADDLLPGLVTARGARARRELVNSLRDRLSVLLGEGTYKFEFGQLLGLLKSSARSRWAALLNNEIHTAGKAALDEQGEQVPIALPDGTFESADTVESLARCVTERLRARELRPKTRLYVEALWEFVRLEAGKVDRLPSQRSLAKLLGIPKDRFPELFELLRAATRDCLADRTESKPLPNYQSSVANQDQQGNGTESVG